MKSQPRLEKRRNWFIVMLLTGAVFVFFASGTLASTISTSQFQPILKLTELLYSVPLAQLIAEVIPQGDSPLLLPWPLVIMIIATLPLSFSSWRFHFHRKRFIEEEKARDLSNI